MLQKLQEPLVKKQCKSVVERAEINYEQVRGIDCEAVPGRGGV